MEISGQLHASVRMGEEGKNLLPLLGCKPQIVQPEAYSLHRLRYPVPPQKLSIVQHKTALFYSNSSLCYGVLLMLANLRQFLDQILRTSVTYRVNKPTEGEIYIYTKKILYKHKLAVAYLPIYCLLTVKENT
jgi:hypothetical protein